LRRRRRSHYSILNRNSLSSPQPQPLRLSDYDQIVIADNTFTFRQPEQLTDDYRTTFVRRTIREIENVPCWLLVADIENFTPISRSLTTDKLAELIGGWVATCKEIIEANQGMIDKYLGDGFFAYWREDPNAANNVAAALGQLKQAQEKNEPRSRLALHFGLAAIGRCAIDGRRKFNGRRRQFCFRMEKLAASLCIFVAYQCGGKSKTRLANEMRAGRRSRAQRLRRETRIF
jgi:class 3 adenylate cyclase